VGLKTIILPKLNEPDLDDVPEEVKKTIHFIFVETVDQVLRAALEAPPKPKSGIKKGIKTVV
jgi:ATP-dependent Lon protease